MPKLKDPSTLKKIAKDTLARIIIGICQKAVEAIASDKTPRINIRELRQYLYGELPHLLCCEVTAHILSAVDSSFKDYTNNVTYDDYGNTDIKIIMESVILGSVYPDITILDTSNLWRCAASFLTCQIHTFQKLQTLILKRFLPTDVAETLPIGLSYLKFLVIFQMQGACTDAIIQTLGSCCSTTIEHINVNDSEGVTDASFNAFMKCQKLTHLSICRTSITADGYVRFLNIIKQHQKPDHKSITLAQFGVGPAKGVTSRLLSEIGIACPMLNQLEIYDLRGDFEALISLTTLEALIIRECYFDKCNLDGFLRQRGINLTSLVLEGTESIDLASIMNQCINIKKLCVLGGFIVDTALGNSENSTKPFQNLEILKLSCKFSLSSIESMLYACINVTRLSLRPYDEDIIEEVILHLLSYNPLQKLTNFTVFSPKLSMISVKAIIDHCPLLEELCFDCGEITYTQVKILRLKLKNKNQNLMINNY